MLYHLDKTDKSIGTKYNIEYICGNGKHNTFSGILQNIDNESFWFEVDGCISKIKQEIIVWMLPIIEKYKI